MKEKHFLDKLILVLLFLNRLSNCQIKGNKCKCSIGYSGSRSTSSNTQVWPANNFQKQNRMKILRKMFFSNFCALGILLLFENLFLNTIE